MNFDIRSQTILFTLAGSRAYGIHTEESDVDVKGVCLPPKEILLGCVHNFEQADGQEHIQRFFGELTAEEQAVAKNTKLEGTVYGLQKFMGLAADCNPNILDVLFCRDEDVRLITPLGKLLRDNRNRFLSTKARWTFSGYAMAQLKRIKTHRRWLLNPVDTQPTRKEFGLPERTVIPKDQLEAAMSSITKKMDSWEIDFGDMPDSSIVYVQEQIGNHLAEMGLGLTEKFLSAGRVLGFTENFLELLDKERQYGAAKREWESYQNWKATRNKDRAALEAKFGLDVKHAGHLFRLLTMGVEILTTGEVHVWRGDRDAELIRSIRQGAWSYDKLVGWAEEQDARLGELYKKCTLPKQPDRNALNNLCVSILGQYLKEGSL